MQFRQPDSSAITLNRVVGNLPSELLGSLTANGRVFLVNPRGVYFGPSSRVDVGGLVASVADIANEDFLAGRYAFVDRSRTVPGASVVNAGRITAGDGGFVVLAGDRVENSGLVEARLGEVVLASGRHVTLDIDGDGLVGFAVDETALGAVTGVENTGTLAAEGGRVVLSARVAGDLAASAVNHPNGDRCVAVLERAPM